MRPVDNSKFFVRLPLLLAITLAGGVFIGATMFGGRTSSSVTKGVTKFREILNYVDKDYVDTVNTEDLVDYSIEKMLEKLDPHTTYIPSKDLEMARTQLESDFDGIGIEFNIFKDTVYVIAPFNGGPAETAGLRAGDKIVSVNGQPMVGTDLENSSVFTKLRGPRGTKVRVGIIRKASKAPVEFTITRNRIPQYSIDAAYMVDNTTGYIKVNRFASNTYDEFKKSLSQLKRQGMQQLVLDLRGNPGGYMDRATNMADEFLSGDKLIVYTDGKEARYDQKIKAFQPGIFEKGALVVLIDEGSASASEIVAGALQDNDRALIVGRRSFGKGLVQAPIPLDDGSELRLTISRYYTPSGRSIQKPYTHDGKEDYGKDVMKRYEHGEFFNADSIKFDPKLKYYTSKRRLVYGGGGIMPDYFVPLDTTHRTKYLDELISDNVIREYAFNYWAEHRKELEKLSFNDFRTKFTVSEGMMQELVALGSRAGIKTDAQELGRSKDYIRNQVKALLAKSIFQSSKQGYNNEFYQISYERDPVYQRALQLFAKASDLEAGRLATVNGK